MKDKSLTNAVKDILRNKLAELVISLNDKNMKVTPKTWEEETVKVIVSNIQSHHNLRRLSETEMLEIGKKYYYRWQDDSFKQWIHEIFKAQERSDER